MLLTNHLQLLSEVVSSSISVDKYALQEEFTEEVDLEFHFADNLFPAPGGSRKKMTNAEMWRQAMERTKEDHGPTHNFGLKVGSQYGSTTVNKDNILLKYFRGMEHS